MFHTCYYSLYTNKKVEINGVFLQLITIKVQYYIILIAINNMDIFEYPDDYKPEKYLTTEEMGEITDYLQNHPLFMKEIPENIQNNPHLTALREMQEEQDPTEAAQGLNKQAGNRLKQHPNQKFFMKEAYAKYSEAINLKCPSASTNAKLHANRAQMNLQLKNYGKVIQDCRVCLKFDKEYTKGYYRYAKALMFLQKYEDIIKLLQDRKEEELKVLLKEASKHLEEKNKIESSKKQAIEEKTNQIREYFIKKGYKNFKRDAPLPEGAKIQIIEGKLSIPLMIIYPQFRQFDLVASSLEEQKIKQHLKPMIEPGLPWDLKKQYDMSNIQIYCEVSEAILMKIPKQASVADIATRIPMKDCLELQIVSTKSGFYNNFLTQYKII